MSQGLLMLDLVMWSSRDNCATTCHGGHLVSCPPHWWTWALRVQPLFHAILVSSILLMPLSGSRTGGSACSLIPRLDVGYMHPCIFSLALSPVSRMWTTALATDLPRSVFQLFTSLTASRSCAL